MRNLIDKLNKEKLLSLSEYRALIENPDPDYAAAVAKSVNPYKNQVYIRGLIEISNICKNDCLYCGIRCSNKNATRYRLTKEQIEECADIGYKLGFRTFVLQSGEDSFYTDAKLIDIVSTIKNQYPDCALTLSMSVFVLLMLNVFSSSLSFAKALSKISSDCLS